MSHFSRFFSLADSGPSHWKEKFPMCGGKNQSPINIDTKKVQCNNKVKDFFYHRYDTAPKTPFTVYAFEGAQIGETALIYSVLDQIIVSERYYDFFIVLLKSVQVSAVRWSQ